MMQVQSGAAGRNNGIFEKQNQTTEYLPQENPEI